MVGAASPRMGPGQRRLGRPTAVKSKPSEPHVALATADAATETLHRNVVAEVSLPPEPLPSACASEHQPPTLQMPMPEAPVPGALAKQQPATALLPPPAKAPAAAPAPAAVSAPAPTPAPASPAPASTLAGSEGAAAQASAASRHETEASRKRPGETLEALSRAELLRRKAEQAADATASVARLLAKREALACQLESAQEAASQKLAEANGLREQLQSLFSTEEGCRERLKSKTTQRLDSWQGGRQLGVGGLPVAQATAAAAVVVALKRPVA